MRKSGLWMVVVAVVMLGVAEACPSSCVCKWKNGKQTVECNDKGLLSIPGGMDAGTQVLDLSGNSVDELHAEIFLKMDLINLQRIYMARCRIHSIDERTFKGLTNLVELDLTGNLLEAVPTDAFVDCPSLMRLTLNANPIRTVRRATFAPLSFLSTLEMSECEIESLEVGAFQGLHSLEWLRLDGNQLRMVKGGRVLPENLRGVELQGNPWECDCHLLEMRSWLETFSIASSAEPICAGPKKHSRRPVKSIPSSELACLPDVSPTTLYLEIGEGKNISLICSVHAIPEARISWWFQGQLLQNDSLVSPGLRLLYYIEEGEEDKRSELFIYNTSPEDNGTFVCTAENPAGAVASNYTIRIIVKEEPIIVVVAVPFEYLLAATVGVVSLLVILAIALIACIVKYRRNRRRLQKREKTKEVALQYQENNSKVEEDLEQITDELKQNILSEPQVMFYSPPLSKEVLNTMSPLTTHQIRSPLSLRHYHLEQNPDLINDTESVGRRREGDGEDDHDSASTIPAEAMHPNLVQFPISCLRGSRKLYSLHSWDGEQYPADYGLPKMVNAAPQSAENFYRTLPYNRAAKRHQQSAANPLNRFSREAEFLSRSSQYEQYCPADVRYTADGYPARPELMPSPPEGYKSETCASLPCTSSSAACSSSSSATAVGMTPAGLPWPVCVPANMHMINHAECNQSKYANINKRCVGAQTDTSTPQEEPAQNDTTTESPDEGYEGEPGVVL
ncbi:PREDICTED: leucine-rich repeat-containing protein 24 [Nicrophorus vespilloides]|uniref:Leucine-rich repeat-containing protein 24 n=1 Tax=Nicrophorus vespilloides TaxID=110193 RepID=A0ABM1M4C4_NICVS|nr:PREDICTED: leucine-rich repeat-containing protein 24 [Nicrophorus vespilloides]